MSSESAYRRTYFYVGGQYIDDGSGAGHHVFQNQMYVEQLTPLHGPSHPHPLVFIHGRAQTGTNWLNTPDGRKGWASWFIDQGYEVFIVDQTRHGRSPWIPGDGRFTTYSAEIFQERFTACRDYKLWPQAGLHTQWPGTGKMGDPIFDAYYASTSQFQPSTVEEETAMQLAGPPLLDRIGPAILIAHSNGGLVPWLWADVRPALVKAIVSIEPRGPPFEDRVFETTSGRPYGLTNIPLTFEPAVDTKSTTPLQMQRFPPAAENLTDCVLQADPARQLVNLAKIPVLLVTGEASYHAPYDHCTVEFLRQAGVRTEHLRLADVGIHGNGHMLFLEKNNLEIAEVLEKWIANI